MSISIKNVKRRKRHLLQTLGRHFRHLVLLLNALPVDNAGLDEVHQLGGGSKKLDKVKRAKPIKKVFTGQINKKENDKRKFLAKKIFGIAFVFIFLFTWNMISPLLRSENKHT